MSGKRMGCGGWEGEGERERVESFNIEGGGGRGEGERWMGKEGREIGQISVMLGVFDLTEKYFASNRKININ